MLYTSAKIISVNIYLRLTIIINNIETIFLSMRIYLLMSNYRNDSNIIYQLGIKRGVRT